MTFLEILCNTYIMLEDQFNQYIKKEFNLSISQVYSTGELHYEEFIEFIKRLLPNKSNNDIDKYWKCCFKNYTTIPQFVSVTIKTIMKLVNKFPEFRESFRKSYILIQN